MGNRQSGHRLYAEAYPTVKAFVWSRASGLPEQDREDILSEAMLASKIKLERYNGSCAFSTFVIGFVKHKIQEMLKSHKRQNAVSQKIIDITPVTSEYSNPLNIILERELRENIEEAQRMLSDEHRQVIALRHNGMTARQIADTFGFTADAVNSMYYRAIKALKNNFEHIFNNCDDFSPKQTLTNRR
jgi:RNA polymerase sigma factor (sigma-70 family)